MGRIDGGVHSHFIFAGTVPAQPRPTAARRFISLLNEFTLCSFSRWRIGKPIWASRHVVLAVVM
jgi:hypothetical protein